MSANKPKTKAVKEWNFMDQELDDRKKKILKAIIKTYMETGEPVGSRTISKFADLNVSSATIRNEMSDLTDMGYIVQPHTSAGRIPSDKGYRLYVDELMKEKESEVQEIKDLMIEKTDKLDEFNLASAVLWNRDHCCIVGIGGQYLCYLLQHFIQFVSFLYHEILDFLNL